MISKKHKNRKKSNWLAYKILDEFLIKHSHMFRGELYDFGCGTAPYRDYFQKHAKKYIGVDYSESQHEIRAEIVADLCKVLPINGEVADTVISLSVLEHLRDPKVMLDEAFRILKPGGNIILQVPWQWWVHEAPNDYYRYTPFALELMLVKAGFSNIEISPTAGFFSTMVLKWNYFTGRFVKGPWIKRRIILVILRPLWFFGQILAPYLDKLDADWKLEAPGYFVTASKN